MSAEEILAKAAELVERPGGWCQGVHQTMSGAVCLRGAIAYVSWNDHAHEAALRAVGKEIGTDAIAWWNDAPGRTAEEVAIALRNAKWWL